MGLFTFFHSPDINKGIEIFKSTDGAILLDVRTTEEYRSGHIEGSRNIPLDRIQTAANVIKEKDKPIFVHCLSGARSAQAVSALGKMGYTNVTNIGGINRYKGKVVK